MAITSPQLAVVAAPVEAGVAASAALRSRTRSRSGGALLRLVPDLAAAVLGAAAVDVATPDSYLTVVLALPLVWLALLAVCGGYTEAPGTLPTLRFRAVVRAAAGLGIVAWATAAAVPQVLVARPTVDVDTAGRTVLLDVALLASLTLAFRCLGSLAGTHRPARVVVAGDPAGIEEVLGEIRRAGERGRAGFEPVGVCLPGDAELIGHDDVQVWHGLDLLDDAVATGDADAVIMVPGPHADHREIRRIAVRLHDTGVGLLVGSGLRDVAPTRLGLGAAGGLGLLHVRPAPLRGPRRRVKAVADRAGAAALLALMAPALLAIGVAVRLDSRGPAVFRQTRVGRDGQVFTMYKFRTMGVDATHLVTTLVADNESDSAGVLFKIRRDPRITRVGALLRRYSLDELPQLVNVLRGEMSLVGPRPALPSEVAEYCPDMLRRLVVRPGLTGLWQISGRSDLSWDETVRLDLQYVDNWSLSLDLLIAARTARAVLGHRGAY